MPKTENQLRKKQRYRKKKRYGRRRKKSKCEHLPYLAFVTFLSCKFEKTSFKIIKKNFLFYIIFFFYNIMSTGNIFSQDVRTLPEKCHQENFTHLKKKKNTAIIEYCHKFEGLF